MELPLVIYQTIYLLFTYVTWIIIKSVKSKQPMNQIIQEFLTKNSFTDEIKNVSWSNVLTNANPEIAFNEFSDSFRKIYKTNFPLTPGRQAL
jgi:hypothetical protein